VRSATITVVPDLVDIHCHIIPGIDDGPEDQTAALAMAEAAVAAGITTVAATPHLRPDFPKVKVDEIAGRCEELMRALVANGIELEVMPAAEVSLNWALEADDAALKMASYGQRGTDILIETPTFGGPMLPTLISEVAARGYRVVLAHPERLDAFQLDPELLEGLVARQVVLQVNADSVLGIPRKSRSVKLARQLVKSGMASVVASDGHRGSEYRPISRLAEAQTPLGRLQTQERAEALVSATPAAVLAGERLPVAPQLPRAEAKPRRGFRRRTSGP
jgi:protein-tyrosine phosphatase